MIQVPTDEHNYGRDFLCKNKQHSVQRLHPRSPNNTFMSRLQRVQSLRGGTLNNKELEQDSHRPGGDTRAMIHVALYSALLAYITLHQHYKHTRLFTTLCLL